MTPLPMTRREAHDLLTVDFDFDAKQRILAAYGSISGWAAGVIAGQALPTAPATRGLVTDAWATLQATARAFLGGAS